MRIGQQHPWSRVGQIDLGARDVPELSRGRSPRLTDALPPELAVNDFVRAAVADRDWRTTNYDIQIKHGGYDVLDMTGRVIGRLQAGQYVKVWQEAISQPGKKRILRNVNWGVPNSTVQDVPEEIVAPDQGVRYDVMWRPGHRFARLKATPGQEVGYELYDFPGVRVDERGRPNLVPDPGGNPGFRAVVWPDDVVEVLTNGADGWALVKGHGDRGAVTGYLCVSCVDPKVRIEWPYQGVHHINSGRTPPRLEFL